MRVLVESPVAAERISRAVEWLRARGASERVLVVGATADAAAEVVRSAMGGAAFGWARTSLLGHARELAKEALAHARLVPVGPLVQEALAARVVHRLAREGALGRFAPLADRPGFPRAAARTIAELRGAGVAPDRLAAVAPDLARIHAAFEEEMTKDGLADRATVLTLATTLAAGAAPLPLLLLDVPVRTILEQRLVAALAARAPETFATVPVGDVRTRDRLAAALDVGAVRTIGPAASSLARVQAHLFGDAPPAKAPLDDSVVLLSAPGESRECVEIVRRVKKAAEAGVPFDRIAILLRASEPYRAHLEEALRRAGVPAWLARGSRKPDPGGRAMLALLACAAEGLSASRFAEYLSLGEVPDARDGAPPAARPTADRFVAPDEELVPDAIRRAQPLAEEPDLQANVDPSLPVVAGSLRAPIRWERLLVDAAVIGGRERWVRRLDGLANELALDLGELEDDDPHSDRVRRSIADLESLRAYAMPLVEVLEGLGPATWGTWIDRLSSLATRALRRPDRVLEVLSALQPMADLGPIDLAEVRLVLGRRLADLVVRPEGRPSGRVWVGPAEEARGLAFDVVLVPGLAEKVFPKKVSEDPLLRDDARVALGLPTNHARVDDERLALRLAVGAATTRLVLSYPRLDVEQSRPRVPSFYGLEVLRAAEGELPGFDDLARRAEAVGAARIGWPAPESSEDAIDEAEHDLALLRPMLRAKEGTAGTARYLLDANPHLGRALRFRARRWHKAWTPADGFVKPLPEMLDVLRAKHALSARSFSPTALQNFSACPYKFLLYAVHKLAPREEPAAIEEMDPLEKGSLVHEVLFLLLEELRAEGLLPIGRGNLAEVRARLDAILARVATSYEEKLAPAIPRVWEDGIASIQADLREWLRRAADDESGWVPWRFELSFGLAERRARDPMSRDEPVVLDCGVRLRGSIDLVEKNRFTEALRVTDYKTGKARAEKGTVVGGGETLQPVLYALTIEKIFEGTPVESGRLYYLTAKGGYEERTVPLDDVARERAKVVADTIGEALTSGFLPAAPAERACDWCDYRVHCGPREEQRVRRKNPAALAALKKLRELD